MAENEERMDDAEATEELDVEAHRKSPWGGPGTTDPIVGPGEPAAADEDDVELHGQGPTGRWTDKP